MRAAIRVSPGQIAVEDVAEPSRREGETLIAVDRVALCGGDLHYFRGPMPFRAAIPNYADAPYIVCHEAVGRVLETDADAHVQAGDLVTIDPQERCGICAACRSGAIELCSNRKDMGYSVDGAAAELVVVPTERVFRVPDDVSLDAAAATHGLAAVLHALTATPLERVERAMVTGPGPAGLMFTMALLAKLRTRDVTLVGRPSSRLEIGASIGAQTFALVGNSIEELHFNWEGDRGYDLVVETTGAPEVVEAALHCVRPQGTMLLYAPTVFNLDGHVVFRRELRIVGSTGATDGMQPALDLIADGSVPLDKIVTHRFPLDEIQQAFELALAGPERRGDLLKAVICVADASDS